MMKSKNLIAILLLVIGFTNCEKDKKEIPVQENLSNYKIFDVHVQKLSDKSPMGNFNLCFFRDTWHQNGRSYTTLVLDYSKTNLEGNVSFKIPKELIKDSSQIFYYITSYTDDTSYNGRYYGGVEVYNNKNTNNKVIEVKPRCSSYIITDNTVWDTFKIDSIAAFNKNYYSEVIYERNQQLELHADCSETNTIKYYYYSNGIKSKEYTKDIFVPYSSQNGGIVTLTLDFK